MKPAIPFLLFLAACTAVGREHETPVADLPPTWREPGSLADGEPDLAAWWRRLGDPELDRLVERALASGHDLRAAAARVAEARALRGIAAAERLPRLDGTASFERRAESGNTPLGMFVPDTDQYAVGLDASWEIDLWGRVRRAVEAADADLAAAAWDARGVAVAVAAETAAAYVDLREMRLRLAIARDNVALQEQTEELVRSRLDAGLVGARDLAQALSIVASTRSRIPSLEAAARAAENRLAVLVGVAPGALSFSETAPIPRPPDRIAVGVPADLLRRRPDVRRAERTLAAEVARVGVAEGDLYPRLTLGGVLGLAADVASDLGDHDSGTYSFGPSLRWNLFDGGALRARVRAQDARAEQALVAWERTVLLALEEAENAMTAFVREQARRDALAEAADQSRRAVELARIQYEEGLTDFQAVLDSQRARADLEDQLATSDGEVAANLIALVRALGGGFDGELPELVATATR